MAQAHSTESFATAALFLSAQLILALRDKGVLTDADAHGIVTGAVGMLAAEDPHRQELVSLLKSIFGMTPGIG